MSGPDVLPIVECGDPVLRRPAEPVDPAELGTSEFQLLIAQMRATMIAAPGVGLAAPQVGVPIQLAVLQDGPERWGQLTEDERTARWAARIVQHEVDHLRGRLYLDRVETRSLCTVGSYGRLWAGRPAEDAAASLGFTLR
jgi:peptide deformylase